MKKAFGIPIAVAAFGVAAWFLYQNYQLTLAERELMEHMQKPVANVSFWNQTEMPITVRVTSEDGGVKWVPLSPGGGYSGPVSAGNTLIERVYEDRAVATYQIGLGDDASVAFDVFENRFEPRLR